MAKPRWTDLRDEIARNFFDQGIEVQFRCVEPFGGPDRGPIGVATRFKNRDGTTSETIWAQWDPEKGPIRNPNDYTYNPWHIAAAFNEVGFNPGPLYLMNFNAVGEDPNPPVAPADDPFKSSQDSGFMESWDLSDDFKPFGDTRICESDSGEWSIEEPGGEGEAGK